MNQHSILYIEDDCKLANLVSRYLQSQGFIVTHHDQGYPAVFAAQTQSFDMVLLDIGLADMDGFEVFHELKQVSTAPIIFMTARQSQIDHIAGLDLGAEDYLTKPVSPSILLARINRCLRRKHTIPSIQSRYPAMKFGSLHINKSQMQAFIDGQSLQLTNAEFSILVQLASKPGEMVSREQLFDKTTSRQYDGMNRTIDGRVSRLRKKLGDDVNGPEKIKTVWGKGYIFMPNAWQ
ncbi:response regulator transcription factor [Thalassotalea sp. PS06]|uniref:response regulator transcription factor n=1 Tax=Thalassotalea sp. PS06 TaxID=2594005 RepID=UPI00116331BC|nr:response regulator transcription factor [Thalassotalea sp. PS06]QDP00768.1 response regulator transcription factor [Thalassotalea sp. PS06]